VTEDKGYEIPVKVVDRRWWAKDNDGAATGAADPGSLKPTYVEQLEAQIAEKDRQIQEYLTKYRQAAGEFEEARLRLRREIGKDVERARREVLSEMLEVLDNLDRAIEAGAQAASVDSLLQGVEMVRRQFLSKLESLGVTRIDVAGQQFDPSLHEAITTVPAASPQQDGTIAGVIRHGYRIGTEVLRPAAVAVAKAASPAE
jgi:molecular chaperone GrpE